VAYDELRPEQKALVDKLEEEKEKARLEEEREKRAALNGDGPPPDLSTLKVAELKAMCKERVGQFLSSLIIRRLVIKRLIVMMCLGGAIMIWSSQGLKVTGNKVDLQQRLMEQWGQPSNQSSSTSTQVPGVGGAADEYSKMSEADLRTLCINRGLRSTDECTKEELVQRLKVSNWKLGIQLSSLTIAEVVDLLCFAIAGG